MPLYGCDSNFARIESLINLFNLIKIYINLVAWKVGFVLEVNINEIMDYWSKRHLSFAGVFIEESKLERVNINRRTNALCCGFVIPFCGQTRLTLNGTAYTVHPGMIVHAGPDMHVAIESLNDDPWRFAVVHYFLPPHEIDDYPLFSKHFSIPIHENAKIPDLIHQLFQVQLMPGASARFRGKLLFTNLLGEFFEAAQRQLAFNEVSLIEQIMAFIRNRHSEPLSIAQIADDFKIDRRKLAALFERHVGMSPNNYLIECRILKAKELLHTCNCPIKQIAECVGYSDSLYFSKAFKKKIGVSPSEFREKS